MKLYSFANFVVQQLVLVNALVRMSLLVIEASIWLLLKGILLYDDER